MNKFTNKLSYLSICTAALFSQNVVAADVVNGDHVVKGSVCVGTDCATTPSFGFDTIRVKENNVRIKFDDSSSSGSFPNNDWQITANDSSNGGANKFSIDDITGGKTPFTVEAGTPSNTLYVDSAGRIGVGTSTPALDIHAKSGNSPALRIEQDTSSGFTNQAWDISGNETNFFIRDVTNGSKLPFRIKPGATKNSLFIAADGDIGFETETPDGQFDVAHASNANNHAFLISPTSNVGVNIDNGQLPLGLFDVQTTGGVSRFLVNSSGNVGFGTNSPTGRFEVTSLDNTVSYFDIDASGDVGVGTNAPTGRFDVRNSANNTSLLNVSEEGYVAIGTNTPTTYSWGASMLTVHGETNINNTMTFESPTADNSAAFIFSTEDSLQWLLSSRNGKGSDRFVIYDKDVTEVISFEQGGKVGFGVTAVGSGNAMEHSNGAHLTTGGVWTSASSRSLKDDIIDITLDAAKSALNALNPVTFSYKNEPEETYAGFIAEDVPNMVATNDRKSLAPMDIVAVLTKVVQDQQALIEKQNARLDKLEANTVK